MLRVIINVIAWVAEHVTILRFLWVIAVLTLIWLNFFVDWKPSPPAPCTSYSDTNREHVPARCFSDFLGKDSGTHE